MNHNSRTEEPLSSTPEPSTSKAILEKDRLTELFGDDLGNITSMLNIYTESQAELMKELLEALSNNPDPTHIRCLAHTIKGSALNFGANALSEQAAKMEERCAGDDLKDALKILPKLQDFNQMTSDAIERYLADNQA
jgi:HPt (histidine-containing phosphotransfer) domain-containing protein